MLKKVSRAGANSPLGARKQRTMARFMVTRRSFCKRLGRTQLMVQLSSSLRARTRSRRYLVMQELRRAHWAGSPSRILTGRSLPRVARLMTCDAKTRLAQNSTTPRHPSLGIMQWPDSRCGGKRGTRASRAVLRGTCRGLSSGTSSSPGMCLSSRSSSRRGLSPSA